MGCDFSKVVKQSFTDKVTEVNRLEKLVKKRQKHVEKSVQEFNNITGEEESLCSLNQTLIGNVVRIESLLKEIQRAKHGKSNETLNLYNPVVPLSPSREMDEVRHFIEEAKSSNKGKILHTTEFEQPGSILDDPEILALIQKNRKILFRKLSR